MASASIQIEAYNPSVQPNGAPIVSTTGGSIGTYANLSFAIVANYQPYDGTGDRDWFGVDMSTRVAHVWDGLSTGGSGTSKITFPIIPPMIQVSPVYHPVYPRSYLVLVQEAATFDFNNPAAMVLESFDSTATELVVLDDVNLGSKLIPPAVSIIFDKLYRMEIVEREMTTVVHNGYVAGKALTNFSDVRQINLFFPGGSITHEEANRLKKWRQSGRIHVRVTDSSSGDEDTDPYTNIYEGKVIASNFTNSKYKETGGERKEFMVSIAVYNTVVSSGVPITSTVPPP